MTTDVIGQICALGAAITWAMAMVLFKRSGETIAPLPLNCFKNAIGVLLLTITLLAIGDGFDSLAGRPSAEIYILIISGVLGIAVADTLFFYGLNLIGVGLISIVDCSYSPFIIFFSYLMLAEKLSVWHYIGGALIVVGVYISSRHSPPVGRTRGQIAVGVLLTLGAMATMTFSIVWAKPVLDVQNFPLVWATMIRMFFGTLALAIIMIASSSRRSYWSVFRPSRTWAFAVPGSVLGAYLSLVFWMAGFKYARASIAAMLNQTSVIFALIFATFMLKEVLTRRKLIAVVLAMTGVFLTMGGSRWQRWMDEHRPHPGAEVRTMEPSPAHRPCAVRFSQPAAKEDSCG